MIVIVDIEGILPEGFVVFNEELPLDMDLIPIFEFLSEAQLHRTTVDDIKWEIQDLDVGNAFIFPFEHEISNYGFECFPHIHLDIHMASLYPLILTALGVKF